MAFYPDIDAIYDPEANRPLFEVKRAYISMLSHFVVAFLMIIAIVIVDVLAYDSEQGHIVLLFGLIPPRFLAVAPALILLNVVRLHYNDLYSFQSHRVVQYGGRIAVQFERPQVVYLDLKAVNVQQDLVGRIFNYGDVQLGTPAEAGYEMTIKGVRGPEELAKKINRLRTLSQGYHETENAQNQGTNMGLQIKSTD